MAAGFDQAGVGFDSADYTFDGTFLGVAAGSLFLSVYLTARNITQASAFTIAAADPASVARVTSQNVGVI